MSQRQKVDVSKIVEDFKSKYPNVARKELRKIILVKFPEINPRTLDRHLRKIFQNEPSEQSSFKDNSERVEVSENMLEFWKDAEWLAKQWKVFEPLKELADIDKELHKKFRGKRI